MFHHILFSLLVTASTPETLPSDPLVSAAQYFDGQHQFEESLKLWSALAVRYPENTRIILKLADYELWISGRLKARETLRRALRSSAVPTEYKFVLRDRLSAINSVFLSDEGQSQFLQAVSKAKRGDYEGSEELLQSANRLENINSTVLRELSRCQGELRAIDRYSETLQNLLELEPYDWKARLALADALLHQKRSAQAIPLLKEMAGTAVPAQTRLASALYDNGEVEQALHIFRELAKRKNPHPIVWYYLGRGSEGKKSASNRLFETFLAGAKKNRIDQPWDPFHLVSRMEEIEKKLSADTLTAPPVTTKRS